MLHLFQKRGEVTHPRLKNGPQMARIGFVTYIGTHVAHSSAYKSLIFALLTTASLSGLALMSSPALAQWWTAAPADYEDCAERVEKSTASKDAKAAALSDCESKFAGRRKRGGGYTYHDFMQNRSFDIAGPNPTAAEQKAIDEQYKTYLDSQRRSVIVAAFAEKQREAQTQAALETDFRQTAEPPSNVKPVVLPRPRPKVRVKEPDCAIEPLACGWSKLSSGLKDIKDALFGTPAPAKTKRT